MVYPHYAFTIGLEEFPTSGFIVGGSVAGGNPPVAIGIPDVTVFQAAPNTVINLEDFFTDPEDPPSALTYAIVGNTNPDVFSVPPSINVSNQLTLVYSGVEVGSSILTIRATDTSALFVHDAFTVTVEPVNLALQFVRPQTAIAFQLLMAR